MESVSAGEALSRIRLESVNASEAVWMLPAVAGPAGLRVPPASAVMPPAVPALPLKWSLPVTVTSPVTEPVPSRVPAEPMVTTPGIEPVNWVMPSCKSVGPE